MPDPHFARGDAVLTCDGKTGNVVACHTFTSHRDYEVQVLIRESLDDFVPHVFYYTENELRRDPAAGRQTGKESGNASGADKEGGL